jgi:tRNA A-37 threonylcarbamoyl transferase component Bud32
MIGQKIGPYEVVARLGEGGMGAVYRARDTRLGRDVALKLLPAAVLGDPDRLRRFEREAKTLASLNHPHIAQLYGVETMAADGRETPVIVMELVPGRTLSAVIVASGASGLSVEDALPIATQIADALEAAHDAGIVHRDLKPANVIVRDDGVVKVLDFGLARSPAQEQAEAGAVESDAMTVTSPARTQAGVILGTAAYMSPEQARGRVADRRADIWAFGAVLFEMLTGRRVFDGETVTEVLAAVLKDPVHLDRLPPGLPAPLRHLLSRCLERDPRMRLRDIGEARIALAGVRTADVAAPAAEHAPAVASPGRGRWAALGALAAIAMGGVAAYLAWPARPSVSIPVRRFELPAAMAPATIYAISPDGRRIAYITQGHLFVHALDTATTADLGTVPPQTEGLHFSPDGRRLAYSAESDLRLVPAEGGPAFTVCRIPGSGRMLRGWWDDDGTIYFVIWRENLYRVPASGGTPVRVAAVAAEQEIDFHSVSVLPDRRLIVTTHLRGEDAIRVDLVDGATRTPLAGDPDIDKVLFRAPDQLLFVRVRRNPGVWVVPFRADPIDLTRATLLVPGADNFSASVEGTIVASVPARERRDLVWVAHGSGRDASGATTSTRSSTTVPGLSFEPGTVSLAISPDGRRAAFSTRAADGGEEYVVRDLSTGRDTRIPSPKASTGVPTGGRIAWTPAGRLLIPAGGVEAVEIYDWPADGSANGRRLVPGVTAEMTSDGRDVVFIRDERSHLRLYRAPIQADGMAGEARPVFPAGHDPNVRYFDLSPDNRLLAFTEMDRVDGRHNIFVTKWPDLQERQQVTTEGATSPRFSKDSRQLFYVGGGRTTTGVTRGELRVVAVTASPLSVGASKLLMLDDEPGAPNFLSFATGSDGRLLMRRVAPQSAGDAGRMVLLQNWPAAAGR